MLQKYQTLAANCILFFWKNVVKRVLFGSEAILNDGKLCFE